MRYLLLLCSLVACQSKSLPPRAALVGLKDPTVAIEVRADTTYLSTGTRCIYSTFSDSTHGLLPKQASSCIQQFRRWAIKQPF